MNVMQICFFYYYFQIETEINLKNTVALSDTPVMLYVFVTLLVVLFQKLQKRHIFDHFI